MNLVIVESPAKGKTIEKYLGPDFKVLASFGHIRDLPKSKLGIDIENDFKPEYVVIPRAKKTIALLKKEAQKASGLILATDFDREGEAIAFHLRETLKEKGKNKEKMWRRITFTEITKEAVQDALKHPRDIDINLVHSQQARRVLDRLVGYKLSPLLWKKISYGLSAGRVQSVSVRLIVEREREIEAFVLVEYWRIIAKLKSTSRQGRGAAKAEYEKLKNAEFDARLIAQNGKIIEKLSIKTEGEAKKMLDGLNRAEYKIKDIKHEEIKKYPYPPFVTSTMQQESFHKLGFSAKKTMYLAQQLYEKGLISYHRTDSTNLSQFALNSARKYIKENFGEKYLPQKPRIYKTRISNAQEAHEAIRPTNIANLNVKEQKSKITEEHQKLYDLIWKRMVASQMSEAVVDKETILIDAKTKKENYTFLAEGQRIKFDGFFKVCPSQIQEFSLPVLSLNELLQLIKLSKEQHFTKPPQRFTEATLIKALEKEGIGRPSTYAPIISTIQDRGYVGKSRQYLFPQDIGSVVNDLLVSNFGDIVDLKFTAKMENELDEIAEGKKKYVEICRKFWGPFSKKLSEKEKELTKQNIIEDKTDEVCEKCGAKMVVKLGRYGKFLSCSNFPTCKNAKPIIKSTGIKCPKCKKGEVIERKNKKGQNFYGCSRYPKCDFTSGEKPEENVNSSQISSKSN